MPSCNETLPPTPWGQGHRLQLRLVRNRSRRGVLHLTASGTNASLNNVADAHDETSVIGLNLSVDQWLSNQQVMPDLVKCDVEGAERLVFRGGPATLAKHKLIVFDELLREWSKPFGYHPNDLITVFVQQGCHCFAIGESGVRMITEFIDETPETK